MSFSRYSSVMNNDDEELVDDEMEMDFLRERYQEDNRNYDVFLSFRGEETRFSFTSHLYTALQNAGIVVFKDDESLPRGSQISPSLRLAIEQSRVSVVVFSRNYAESRWCMKELEKIMECHRTIGHVVVPVFYDVDPSEVRHQKGEFGKAFQNLQNRILTEANEKLQPWWDTLRYAAGISGTVLQECDYIEEIFDTNSSLVDHWTNALVDAAVISGGSVTYSSEMNIADEIHFFVESWGEGLRSSAFISRPYLLKMEISEKIIDILVNLWRVVLSEAIYDSACGGVLNSSDQMVIVGKIKLLVKHWREARFEAVGIPTGVVLNSTEEMNIVNEIDLLAKQWMETLYVCEADDTSDDGVLNSKEKMNIVNKIDLVKQWRETLYEAAGNLEDDVLNSKEKMNIANEIDRLAKQRMEAFLVYEAYGTLEDGVLNSNVEMEGGNDERELHGNHRKERLLDIFLTRVDVEIVRYLKYLRIHWRDALRAAASISRFLTKSRGKVDELKRWTKALHEAAGIAGVVVLNSRNESEAIKHVVENVAFLLDKSELFIADNPVGVEPRVQEIIELLDQKQSSNVLILGMWGMGGIGKTTIAKAIYNKIGRNFDKRSFLAHIREDWGQDDGQVRLQEQLLIDIEKGTNTKIHNVESGKIIIKERLRHKRVLLILDDVNKLNQLNILFGSREWFGPGSRIIITTRDMHILRGRRVDKVVIMKGMDEDESLELFSWNAFKQPSPIEDFSQLSRNVVAYSGGLPLALEVLGSYLFDMEVTAWKNVLEKLRKIPNEEVQEKLKISYDGLSDDTEKGVFLDIACFFIGMDRNDVIHILNGCGYCAEDGIRVLVERSLVTVDDKNKLGMHDLLRDMGREIIRSKSPMEIEERSRLWFQDDVLDVLSKEKGTKAVEGLALKLSRTNIKCLSTKAFKEMKKLRLLQLAGVQLVGDFTYLSRDLRWLCWHGFPLTSIPTNFYQASLVSIELQNSNVNLLWKEAQVMEKLKILNLSHSHYLTQTPDFSNLPNLEKLVLIDCPRLSRVSYTIGHLNKVLLINFQDCISLRELPRSIYKLKSLRTLILSGCLKIDKLEEDLEQMESLTTLIADQTAITRVPFSIVRSKSIGYISLCGYEGFSRNVFPSIIWSWMSPTNNLSPRIQTSVNMSSLTSLYVPNGSSNHLSYISEDLPKLQSLWIECGSELQLSLDTRNILDALYNTNSEDLESSATTSQMHDMDVFTLIECSNQVHNFGSQNFVRSLLTQMGVSCQVINILKKRISQSMITSDDRNFLLPDDNYPDWLTFNSEGSSVTFEIPQINGRNLKKMMCHVHYSSTNNITSDGLKNLLVINHTKAIIQLYKRNALASFEEEEWQRVLSKLDPGDKVQIVVVFWNTLTVNKTTIYLIYEPMDEKISHCHAPNNNVIVSGGEENVIGSMSDLRNVSQKNLIRRLLNNFLSCNYFCRSKSEKKKIR